MDSLKYLIENNSKNICFLCFTQTQRTCDLNEVFEIYNRECTFAVSLSEMVNELFPLHKKLLNQACEDCSNIIIHIYIIMQKHHVCKELLSTTMDNIDEQMNKKLILGFRIKTKKCNISIKIPLHLKKVKLETDIVNQGSMQDLDLHVKDNENLVEIKCNKCTMAFPDQKLLQKHKRLAHFMLNKAIVCEICGKICKTSTLLKSHLKGHKKTPCPYCGKILKTHAHFRVHIKNHKTNFEKKSYHTIYKCNDCSYQSVNKMSLEAHINKIHLKLRPYVCQLCFKGFYKKSNLTEHCKIHLSTKIDTCEICGDSFVNKKCLLEHSRLHTGEKPYECEMCGDKFVSNSRKSEHFKRKHLEKTETCYVCGKKYSMKKDLNRHFKNVHKKEEFQTNVENVEDVNTQNQSYNIFNLTAYN